MNFMSPEVQRMLAEHFFGGAGLGFLLGVTVTLVAMFKFREWEERREKQKWYVRRGVWTR